MELLVTVWLEWKHLADLACPCLHPRAGGVSLWALCAILCCCLPCPALQRSSCRGTPSGRQWWSKEQGPVWAGGMGSVQDGAHCSHTAPAETQEDWVFCPSGMYHSVRTG